MGQGFKLMMVLFWACDALRDDIFLVSVAVVAVVMVLAAAIMLLCQSAVAFWMIVTVSFSKCLEQPKKSNLSGFDCTKPANHDGSWP